MLRGSNPELCPWFDVLGFNVFLFDWLSLLTGGPVLRECLEVGRRLTIGLRDSEPFSSTKVPLAYTWGAAVVGRGTDLTAIWRQVARVDRGPWPSADRQLA